MVDRLSETMLRMNTLSHSLIVASPLLVELKCSHTNSVLENDLLDGAQVSGKNGLDVVSDLHWDWLRSYNWCHRFLVASIARRRFQAVHFYRVKIHLLQ